MATFAVHRTSAHLAYHFDLRDDHDHLLLQSEGYASLADCYRAIQSIREAAPYPNNYRLANAADGRAFFRLVHPITQRVLGTGNFYANAAERDAAIRNLCFQVAAAGVVNDTSASSRY